jgi:hypothetical protein
MLCVGIDTDGSICMWLFPQNILNTQYVHVHKDKGKHIKFKVTDLNGSLLKYLYTECHEIKNVNEKAINDVCYSLDHLVMSFEQCQDGAHNIEVIQQMETNYFYLAQRLCLNCSKQYK